MIKKMILLACVLIAPLAFAQTTVTRETTTITKVSQLNSTHMLTVRNFAPGDKITVETAPNTNPLAIRLDKAVTYVRANGEPVDPSSIQAGSRVRLEFLGTGEDRTVVRVVLLAAD